MNKIKNDNQGFTLLELLVVVLIIGILAAIALPRYKFSVYKSQFARLQTYEKALVDSYQRFYLLSGHYTTKFEDLDIDFPYDRETSYSWAQCRINGDIYCCVAGGFFNAITCGNMDYSLGIWTQSIPTTPRTYCVTDINNKMAVRLCKSMWNGKELQATGHFTPDGISAKTHHQYAIY